MCQAVHVHVFIYLGKQQFLELVTVIRINGYSILALVSSCFASKIFLNHRPNKHIRLNGFGFRDVC